MMTVGLRASLRALDRFPRAAPWLVALATALVSTVLATNVDRWNRSLLIDTRARDVLRLCDDWRARDLIEPIMAYRLTLPLLAHGLHWRGPSILIVPYVCNLAMLAVVFMALRRRIAGPWAAAGTLLTALSYAFFWSNWFPGFADSISHVLTATLLLTTSVMWLVPAVFFGLLNDERFVLGLPFVWLWHKPPEAGWRDWCRASRSWLLCGAFAVMGYALLRHALTIGWVGPGVATPAVYLRMGNTLREFRPYWGTWGVWSVNVLMSYRWVWLVLVWYARWLWTSGQRLFFALFVGSVVFGSLASIVTVDVSRTLGFLFPAVLLAWTKVPHIKSKAAPWAVALVGLMLVSPVFIVGPNYTFAWIKPLPLVLARIRRGFDLVAWPR